MHIVTDSIQITGHGPARITDTQSSVGLRRENFDDVTSDDAEASLDEEDSDNDFGVDKTNLNAAETERIRLANLLDAAQSELHALEKSKVFLEEFKPTHETYDTSKLEQYLSLYQRDYPKLTVQGQQISATIRNLEKELKTATKAKDKLQRQFDRARKDAAKPERQQREKKRKAHKQIQLQRRRDKIELQQLRTDQVTKLIVRLDGFQDGSGCSSRRGSVASAKKRNPDLQKSAGSITLSLTYVTPCARWRPRYELNLNTPASSGRLFYRAEYRNGSSETWKDAKIVLSTSQTTFSGVNETIPLLNPWTVKLLKYDSQIPPSKSKDYWQGGLETQSEVRARKNVWSSVSVCITIWPARN